MRPQNHKKASLIKYFIIIIILIVVAYLLSNIFSSKTFIVKEGSIQENCISDAIIVNREWRVLSPLEGAIELKVKQGDRVRVGAPLFKIITDRQKQKDYISQISETEAKIEEVQSSYGTSIQLLDNSIKDTEKKLKEAISMGEYNRTEQIKKQLLYFKKQKKEKMQLHNNNLENLIQSLDNAKNGLALTEKMVHAPVSGIISFNIDSMEELISLDNLESLSYAQLKKIKINKHNGKAPSSVEMNQPVLKIVDNYSWYLIVPLEEKLDEGKNYEIEMLDSQRIIKAKLKKFTDDDEKPLAVFIMNKDLDELFEKRWVKVKIHTKTHYGNIVPISALVEKDNKIGVTIQKRRRRMFKAVDVIAQDKQYAVVKGLKIGDKIILNKR